MRKKKKGYLLVEIVIYIGLVGILLICVMNLSIFMAKQYKSNSIEIKNTTRWIEIDRAIASIIKKGNGKIEILRTHTGCNNCDYFNCDNKKECCDKKDCLKKCDIHEIKIGEYKVNDDREILRISMYPESGKDVGMLVYGKESSSGTIAKEIIDFKAKSNGELIYITFTFKDGSEKIGVYEK